MTVQELIAHLGQFDPQTQVMFSITDDTDWNSKYYMLPGNVKLGDVSCDDDTEDEIWNDEGEYIGPEVVLFDLNI